MNEKMPQEVLQWFSDQPNEFDATGLQKCNAKYGKCVALTGYTTSKNNTGTVMEKHRDSQQYTIQWVDGSRSAQQTIHMFGAFSHLPQPCLHSHVLACSDPVELKFLPGTVTKCVEGIYSVKFYDGTRQDNINQNQCFWLEETYYHEAVKFCKQHQPTH